MQVTDPIADYLTRIRNAQMAGHRIVEIPASNIKKSITEILYDQGYILKYTFEEKSDEHKQGLIKIALKYDPTTKKTDHSGIGARESSRTAEVFRIWRYSPHYQRAWYNDRFYL